MRILIVIVMNRGLVLSILTKQLVLAKTGGGEANSPMESGSRKEKWTHKVNFES